MGMAFLQFGLSLPEWLGTPLTLVGIVLLPMVLLSLGARLANPAISDGRVGVEVALPALG